MTTRTSIEIRTIHGEDLHNLLRDESARTEVRDCFRTRDPHE